MRVVAVASLVEGEHGRDTRYGAHPEWLTDWHVLTGFPMAILYWLGLEDEDGLGRDARPEPERAEQRRVLLRRAEVIDPKALPADARLRSK